MGLNMKQIQNLTILLSRNLNIQKAFTSSDKVAVSSSIGPAIIEANNLESPVKLSETCIKVLS